MREPRETSEAVRGSSRQWLWCAAAVMWSLIFAAPHFYWASGGRAGLGSQAAAADAALEQTWFGVYNLAAGCLAIVGAVVAVALSARWGDLRTRRWLLISSTVAGVALLLRGALGLTLLGISALTGASGEAAPAILLAIEPWFVLGGIAFGGMARHQRTATRALSRSPDG